MNEHIEDILVGGRPMTKLEKANKEIERLNNIINEIEDSIVGKINVLYQVKNQANAIQELRILLNKIKELKGCKVGDVI